MDADWHKTIRHIVTVVVVGGGVAVMVKKPDIAWPVAVLLMVLFS